MSRLSCRWCYSGEPAEIEFYAVGGPGRDAGPEETLPGDVPSSFRRTRRAAQLFEVLDSSIYCPVIQLEERVELCSDPQGCGVRLPMTLGWYEEPNRYAIACEIDNANDLVGFGVCGFQVYPS